MRISLFILGLAAITQLSFAEPVDTYFSFAITDNSNKHGGDNLLFLDFQKTLDITAIATNIVASPKVSSTHIELDGSLNDWRPDQFTKFQTRAMNNYPLDEFYDVTPTEVHIASAYDEAHIYFAIRYTDPNHDASNRRNRWVRENGTWKRAPRSPLNQGAPASKAVNASTKIRGAEDEDRVFFMFPIVDSQGNFRGGSHGCAGYCHGNLIESGSPMEIGIGQSVSEMHTNKPADIADVWHWTAARTAPANTLRDGFISIEGHKSDIGKSAYRVNNSSRPKGPKYLSRSDFERGNYTRPNFVTPVLNENDLLAAKEVTSVNEGASIPYFISRPPSPGRGDVEVASRFDTSTNQWILELKRKLDTGVPAEDHIFTQGQPATPPLSAAIMPGAVERGKKLFKEKACASCHGDNGEGKFVDGQWNFPRIQRVSGALILKTADIDRPKRLAALAFHVEKGSTRPRALMSTVDLTPQEAEDIAAWLQTQHTPLGK